MSKSNNKLTRSALHISKYESIFTCPICTSPLKVHELRSLICSRNHTFDIARQGHINLLSRQIQTNYDKDLFEARRKVIADSGFFDSFTKEITKVISEQTSPKIDIAMVDMGSGDGSHLNNICNGLHSRFNKTVTGVGIDIARDGILAAAKNYENNIWLVADLANTPLNDKTFDVIVNVLSPSNYEEFNRILKDDGIIVKVVPRRDYLKELRQFFYRESERQDYSNEKIVNHFGGNFQLVDHSKVQYTQTLDQSTIKSLVQMTPLTWGVSDENVQLFLEEGTSDITVDLDILVGRKKNPY